MRGIDRLIPVPEWVRDVEIHENKILFLLDADDCGAEEGECCGGSMETLGDQASRCEDGFREYLSRVHSRTC